MASTRTVTELLPRYWPNSKPLGDSDAAGKISHGKIASRGYFADLVIGSAGRLRRLTYLDAIGAFGSADGADSTFANFEPMRTTISKPAMPILLDKTLTDYADQAFESARLRRNGIRTERDWVSAEMLAELEAVGDAMRYLNSDGQIAWKATPRLRNYRLDLQGDAEADLEEV
jgi:hypothetical protein